MIQMSWIVYFLALCASAFISLQIYIRVNKKKAHITVGTMFIDPKEPEDRGGVYVGFDADPKTFTDGDIVSMTVKIVRK